MALSSIASVLAAAGFDVSKLHPDFQEAALAFLEEAKAAGLDPRLVQDTRTVDQQNKLYAQGRSAPGQIVTKAKGGQSNHNYGVAMDVVPGALLSQKDWAPEDPRWNGLGQLAQKRGLEWGGDWKFKDRPHVQMAGAKWQNMQNDPKFADFHKGHAHGNSAPAMRKDVVPPTSGVDQPIYAPPAMPEIPNAEFMAGMPQNAGPSDPIQKRDIFEGVAQAIQQAQGTGPGGSMVVQNGDPLQAVNAALMAQQKTASLAGAGPNVDFLMGLGKRPMPV